jgi:hypothetical protein
MTFLGIDVAKAQLEFACQPSGETGSMTKDDAGIRTSFILEVLHSHHAIEVPRGNGGLIQATHPVALSDPERNLARELASTRMSRAPRPSPPVLALRGSTPHTPATPIEIPIDSTSPCKSLAAT